MAKAIKAVSMGNPASEIFPKKIKIRAIKIEIPEMPKINFAILSFTSLIFIWAFQQFFLKVPKLVGHLE